jgi:hypothetical protein
VSSPGLIVVLGHEGERKDKVEVRLREKKRKTISAK